MSLTTMFRESPGIQRGLWASMSRRFWVFWILYVVFQAAVIAILSPKVFFALGHVQLSATAGAFQAAVGGWDEAALNRFALHFIPDFILPVWYGLALAFSLGKLMETTVVEVRWNKLIALPLAGALCDIVENCIHVSFAVGGGFAEMSQPFIFLGFLFAAAKWLLMAVSVIAMLILLGRAAVGAVAAWRFIRSKGRPKRPRPAAV